MSSDLELLVEAHHKLTYTNNVKMVAQQTTNPLRAAVTEVPATGEAQDAADLVGKVEYVEGEEGSRRNTENPVTNSKRWLVFPNEIKSGQYIETADKFKQSMDPTQKYTRAHTMAVHRGIQDRILGVKRKADGTFYIAGGGIFGSANEGKRPGTTVDLPAGNYTAAAGVGLTLEKLIAVREALGLADFGMESDDPISCAITAKQITDLLNIAAQTKTALNAYDVEQLKSGKPGMLMGFNWIPTNRLPKNTAGARLLPVWTKSNIVLGTWADIAGAMWNDTSADNLPYCKVGARVDCVRVEDVGVRVIECVEG